MAKEFIPEKPYLPITITTEGFVAKEPKEISRPGAKMSVVVTTIAVDSFSSTVDGIEKYTSWYDLKFFGKKAEAALNNIRKGQVVFVEGRLALIPYETRDGNTGINQEIQVDKIGVSIHAGSGVVGEGNSHGDSEEEDRVPKGRSQGRKRSSGSGRRKASGGRSTRGRSNRSQAEPEDTNDDFDDDINDLIEDVDF